jgi:hypothetical protein
MMHSILVVFSILAVSVHGFVVYTPAPLLRRSSSEGYSLKAAATTADDLFASEAWEPIQKDLDRVPVFTVATEEGNPLAYKIETQEGKSLSVPCFYCDIAAALVELEGARDNTDMKGLDILPFPLGQAFQMWSKDEAAIVPSKQAILQAGAPPGTNPIGQQVPVFVCMDMTEESEDGSGDNLPVFMSVEDANDAVKSAVAEVGGNTDDFEVSIFSLKGIVDLLATEPETPPFRFMPSSTSMKYIRDYLS